MKPTIALDADGVLLNYHHAYRHAWHKAFGVMPQLRDPLAYWPIDRWEVRHLVGNELDHFRACFEEEFWSTIPAIAGAVDACVRLHEEGYELVCVSAIETKFQAARLHNLRDCGFPIGRVIATDSAVSQISPKAAALSELNPIAFVDDYLPYLKGIPRHIHSALILREPNGSPNIAEDEVATYSQHNNLEAFVQWWLEVSRVSDTLRMLP